MAYTRSTPPGPAALAAANPKEPEPQPLSDQGRGVQVELTWCCQSCAWTANDRLLATQSGQKLNRHRSNPVGGIMQHVA
jgi:hypothetical protein